MDIVLYVLNELFLIRKRYYFTIKIMRVRLLRQIESDREKFLGDKEDSIWFNWTKEDSE